MTERIDPAKGVLIYCVDNIVFVIVRPNGISIDSDDKNTLDINSSTEVSLAIWMAQIQLLSMIADGVFLDQEQVGKELKEYIR